MRGIVEVYVQNEDGTETLVESGSNLIVDAAGEVLTDIMCISPSLSSIASASGLLDASNYTIQAASFSKDVSAYHLNAHDGRNALTLSGWTQFSNPRLYVINSNSTSSYTPVNGLPSYADPLDRKLEYLPSSLSSVLVQYGQNLNLIPFWSALSAVSSIGLSGALALGCYPTATTVPNRVLGALFTPTSSFITSSRFNSDGYNSTTSSMDWRGFITLSRTGATLQGVVTSGNITDASTLGEVNYKIRIGADELACASLYGGIFSVGIWCLDIERCLANGIFPPFPYDQINTKREFKLFAKKVFNKNLAYIQDTTAGGLTNYSNLTITWRIRFV